MAFWWGGGGGVILYRILWFLSPNQIWILDILLWHYGIYSSLKWVYHNSCALRHGDSFYKTSLTPVFWTEELVIFKSPGDTQGHSGNSEISDKISSFWRLEGIEGGKLHPHSCIPDARCHNGQIEKLKYLGFSSPTFKVGAHQNQQSTYDETLCLNENVMFHQYHTGKRHPCCDITRV